MLISTIEPNDYRAPLKVLAGELRLGMYVCGLDKPWRETPFTVRGFPLRSAAELDTVRNHCKYAYIDLERSREELLALHRAAAKTQVIPSQPGWTHRAESPVSEVKTHRGQVSHLVDSIRQQVSQGTSPDLQVAKSAAAECAANVLRDPETAGLLGRIQACGEDKGQHAFNVCAYAIRLGHWLGLPSQAMEELGAAGLLHDIGQVALPRGILTKSPPLNLADLEALRSHTTLGWDVLNSGRNVNKSVAEAAYAHHEHIDGTGYPRGLRGNQLSLNTKIVAVVERYDALTSDYPNRIAFNHLEAVRILNGMADNREIDKRLTSLFIACLGLYPPGSLAELSSGEIAIVLRANPKQYQRPTVLVIRDDEGNPCDRLVDLTRKDSHNGKPYNITALHRPQALGIDLNSYRKLILESLR